MVKTTGATPAYVPVGQVQEIGDIGVTAEEVDVTTLDAGDYRDYLQGFKDPGECELSAIFDAELATHDDTANGLVGLFTSGEVRDWAIRWNSSSPGAASYAMFKGFIRDTTYGALNPDDPQMINPLIRLTTPITLTDSPPSTLVVTLTPATAAPTGAGAAGQTFAVAITSGLGNWLPVANQPWITIVSPTTPQAAGGTVTYNVAAQGAATSARSGSITVADKTFAITQAGNP